MKWKDLSLKERKQIYDSVRANNPDATYFDIKEQFDSIPTYEVGRAIEGTDAYTAESYAEPFTPTITKKKKGKKVKTEADYDQEFAEVKRKYNNMQEYDKELIDRDNIMSYNEIRQSLMDVNPNTYRYLTTPSENKAHMIQLKRGMQKEGLINNWTDPITQDKIEEYLSYRSKYANRVNPVLRTLYDIRPDKQGFINRMNNLTPIEWAVPLGLPMFFGEEQENK